MKKKLIIIIALGTLVACGSSTDGDKAEEEVNKNLKTETRDEVKKVEDANVELEQLDGELDSIMNTLK